MWGIPGKNGGKNQSPALDQTLERVIILEFLTCGPMAQWSKNPGPHSQGYGTAHHPPPKSILGPHRTHSLEDSFLWNIKLTSNSFIFFIYSSLA